MNTSILQSIKKLLGIPADYTHFDEDIITQINVAFAVLNELGVGPQNGYTISGNTEIWDSFVANITVQSMCKSFVYLKVKLAFDPPTLSSVLTSMENQLSEITWRLNNEYETQEVEENVV